MRTVAGLEELLSHYPPETIIRFSLDDEEVPAESGRRYFSEAHDDLQPAMHRMPDGKLELTLCLIGRPNQ